MTLTIPHDEPSAPTCIHCGSERVIEVEPAAVCLACVLRLGSIAGDPGAHDYADVCRMEVRHADVVRLLTDGRIGGPVRSRWLWHGWV